MDISWVTLAEFDCRCVMGWLGKACAAGTRLGVVPVAESLPESSGLGLLTWPYPPSLVRRGRYRVRPGRAAQTGFARAAGGVLRSGIGLVSLAPYLEVLRHLVKGLCQAEMLGPWRIPAKSSLFQAREQLGPEPLRILFAVTGRPLADEGTPGVFWRGLQLVTVGSTQCLLGCGQYD
ncbi:transposase domain-containing protein [Streptomyces sp. NPDC002537]